MKVLNWGLSLAVLLILSGVTLAHARGGGNGVPSPFKCVSADDELVTGEAVTIEGEVEIAGNGEAFLRASVKKYPCLQGGNVFLLSGTAEEWQQYSGDSIVLGCVLQVSTLGTQNVIELTPVNSGKPVVLRDNHDDRDDHDGH